MFYLAFLNHSDTLQYRPLFEALYGMEVCLPSSYLKFILKVQVCLLLSFLVAFVPLSMGVFNATPLHLNVGCDIRQKYTLLSDSLYSSYLDLSWRFLDRGKISASLRSSL